ncbi:MAG: hypothetical protein K8W52_38095 [Deltaproteobacteria bacterium]|nr:hypothetical protein [Deltaproteobacteria bacterium]
MTGARHLVAIALAVSTTACIHYTGHARSIDPATVVATDGWVRVHGTPTVRQTGLTDCGPAALAMVAGRWNVALDLAHAKVEAPVSSRLGVRLDVLRKVARAHGLTAFAIAGDLAILEHEVRADRPVIVGLLRPYGKSGALSHYEVVIALRPAARADDTLVVTIDPGAATGAGWQVRRWIDLDTEWQPAGRPALVVLGPTANLAAAP